MSKDDDFFGGMFDFNGDGETSWDEKWLAYKIMDDIDRKYREECSKKKSDDTFSTYEHMLLYDTSYLRSANDLPQESDSHQPKDYQMIYEKKTAYDDPLSEAQLRYHNWVKDKLFGIFVMLLVLLAALTIIGMVIWAVISVASEDIETFVGGIIYLAVLGGLVYVAGVITVSNIQAVCDDIKCLLVERKNFLDSISKEERCKLAKERKVTAISLLSIVGMFILAVGIGLLVSHGSVVKNYKEAEALISEKEYSSALDLLETIEKEEYKDTKALIELCDAYIDYNRGYVSGAYYEIDGLEFKYQSEKQMEEINSFFEIIKNEYEKQQSEYNKNKHEYVFVPSEPYVGMSEKDIANTELGKPSDEVRHNTESSGEGRYIANIYDFYRDGRNIFTARCVNGVVTEVWDHTDKPVSNYVPRYDYTADDDDPYDASDYGNSEDFYYDNYDNFVSYEDAETYYNEHHD